MLATRHRIINSPSRITQLCKMLQAFLSQFLFNFVHMVHDHQTEGERIQNVEELVAAELLVGRELQGGDELVLEELAPVEGLVKTQGSAQTEQKGPQILQTNEGSSFWVILRPYLPEFFPLLVVEQSSILNLRFQVPFKDEIKLKLTKKANAIALFPQPIVRKPLAWYWQQSGSAMQSYCGEADFAKDSIVRFHESPVATVNMVMKALQNPSKFIQSFIFPVLFTSPKYIIPTSEYMYVKSISRAPILESVCNVITKVLKMRARLYPPLFSSLNNLRILNALRVEVPLILTDVDIETKFPMTDPIAIKKSKMFQPSLKYPLTPIAKILTKASTVKMMVNI
ncbi:hypothetical protein FGO68_gene10051 [Halteria grandinella]|uniref:Uncharacterized protein n=1 Tax=Halteria grandinella TaxID=5974 RepID=A0A8J8SY50_HALGN|nr:hypothetical protein FGO68_gene10051 [Halteria grandinella]